MKFSREQLAILHRLALKRPMLKPTGRLSERDPREQRVPRP